MASAAGSSGSAPEKVGDTATMKLADRVAAWTVPYDPEAGPLTEAEVKQFYEDGYVVISRKIIDNDLIEGAKKAVSDVVDSLARELHAAGKIKDLCEDVPLERRLIEIEKQFPNASVLLHKKGILPEGVAKLWGSEQLMGVAKQLVGTEHGISAYPVWNLRTKTPGQEQAVVPWHQDSAYLEGIPAGDPIPLQATAWVPLVDANEENGCMQVLKRGHRSGIECQHTCCVGGTWYVEIAPGEVERIGCDQERDVVTCPVPVGGVLLLNNLIPHRSLANTSDGIRWSLDLRWQRSDFPAGFYGIKECLPVLPPTSGDAAAGGKEEGKEDSEPFVPRWDDWGVEDRQVKQEDAMLGSESSRARTEARIKEAEDKAIAAGTAVAGGAGGDGEGEGEEEDPAFDTRIVGPWMDRWELVHHNKHTRRHEEAKAKGVKTSWHAGQESKSEAAGKEE